MILYSFLNSIENYKIAELKTHHSVWKAISEIFECIFDLISWFGCFEIFWTGAIAFFDALQISMKVQGLILIYRFKYWHIFRMRHCTQYSLQFEILM